jgi:glycosyltransferase involved in cell wall biosynthesis
LAHRVATRVRIRVERERERVSDRLRDYEERRLLQVARAGRDVCWVDEGEAEPLVTIRIPTFNRGQVVADRALASAVAQTYERLEILVVGDACDEATERAVRSVRDPRVRFVNLPTQGIYPDHVRHRRMVAGTHPMNAALILARGSWMAPCDDDDELSSDHVEVLLDAARSGRFEMVHSRARAELKPGEWSEIGGVPLRKGVAHGSVLYTLGLRFMHYSTTSWHMREPADWNLWDRMQRIGVRIGFCDRFTYTQSLGAVWRAELAKQSPDASLASR